MDDLAHMALAEPKVGETAGAASKTPLALQTMRLKVYSPQKVYYDEAATSVSAANATGPFDVLPGHHNFITLLNPCIIDIRRPGKLAPQHIKISGGVMHVKANYTIVFLDV
jgi:F0F1-type ATP synthase epsilon subunit